MKFLPLTKGFHATVSDRDYVRAVKHKWHVLVTQGGLRYGTRHLKASEPGYPGKVLLHRWILNPPREVQVDHRNGDGLCCTRRNMRKATATQNARSFQRKDRHATSKYRGVSWNKQRQRWVAQIVVNRRTIGLGRFKVEHEAALAYDHAARLHFGEFTQFNF